MKIINLIILFTLLSVSIVAQDYLKIDPIEPTAASMAKYGDYPVNYSKGLPSITIPLYQIKSGSLTQDITLSYHGGGIKVNEEATWVGLGWDLFYGGTITRQVHGKPDEDEDFTNVPNATDLWDLMGSSDYSKNSQFDVWAKNEATFMQDVYHFNVAGYSGKFVLDNNHKPMQIPHNPLKFDDNFIAGDKSKIIYAPNGVKYEYDVTDETTILPLHSGVPEHPTTWHISKISSPNSNDFIDYEYQLDGYLNSKTMNYSIGYTKTEVIGCGEHNGESFTPIPLESSQSYQKVKTYKPQYINFNGGRLVFNLSERDDVYLDYDVNTKEIQKLDNIEIQKKEYDGYAIVKTIQFCYGSYFVSDSHFLDPRFTNGKIHPDCIKLKLDSVVEIFATGERKLIAEFEYYEDHLIPKKDSYATDYWGYYNGIDNSTPFVKSYVYAGLVKYQIGGAIKNPNEEFMKTASLKSISYPTKGKTVFDWEMNLNGSDKPFANVEENEEINIRSYNGDHEWHCNREDNGDLEYGFDLSRTVTSITPKISQTILVKYSMYMSDIDDQQHNKYDNGEIFYTVDNVKHYICRSFVDGNWYQYIPLEAGKQYTFKINTNCYNVYATLSFQYNTFDPDKDKYKYPFGGLRIKEITNYDSYNKQLGKRKFTYLIPGTEKSSGFLNHKRQQNYSSKRKRALPEFCATSYECDYVIMTDVMHYSSPIAGITNSGLTYQYVQEYMVDKRANSEGYINYEFSVCEDGFIGDEFPLFSSEWKRGELIKKTIFDENENPVKEIINDYVVDADVRSICTGFKMSKPIEVGTGCDNPKSTFLMTEVYKPHNYYYTSYWRKLEKTTTNEYYNGNVVTTTIDYVYNNLDNYLPTEERHSLKNGLIKIIKKKYPTDYSDDILSSMKELHMIAPLIEMQEWIDKNGQVSMLKGVLNEYNIENNNTVLDKIHVMEFSSPLSSITDGLVNGKYTILKPTSGSIEYEQKVDYNYNVTGRPVEALKEEDQKTAYIWGYNNDYPVAKIENATYQEAINHLSVPTDLDNLNSPTSDNQVRTILAKIRDGFKAEGRKALITIYTYDPAKGITSITDPNGKLMHYNYDGQNRLTSITDHQNNVLKHMEYNFKN